MRADYLLVGGGVAAASCAARLREEGADGSIVVVGREPEPPYNRPPLSKDYLRGESSREQALVQSPSWWVDNDVQLLTRTSVMRIDPGERTARLSTKEDVSFDKALLATGANVRRLRVEGGDLEGIHYVRAFGNSDALAADVGEAERVVIVGGSYLGCELAASLTALGKRCTILMQEPAALERGFGETVGGFFQRVLEDRGVQFRASDELARFTGVDGRVGAVVTAGGDELQCEVVAVAAGVMPDVMLARSAGVEVGETGGIACSAGLETSLPGVFAAGDMAEWHSERYGRSMRVEHWDVAREHGRTAALGMLGRGVAHDALPYFWSELADWALLEYVGVAPASGPGEPVLRGSLKHGEFLAFYLEEDGSVSAALSVGRSEDLEQARRLIGEHRAVERASLEDPDSDLASL